MEAGASTVSSCTVSEVGLAFVLSVAANLGNVLPEDV
jgi:hypothetical protein